MFAPLRLRPEVEAAAHFLEHSPPVQPVQVVARDAVRDQVAWPQHPLLAGELQHGLHFRLVHAWCDNSLVGTNIYRHIIATSSGKTIRKHRPWWSAQRYCSGMDGRIGMAGW